MKRTLLAVLAASLLLSSGAWAGFSIHVDNKKTERRNDPPPPPPPPRERLQCRFEKPDCRPRDRHYRVDYRNRRPMVEGYCDRGDAEGRWDYYCNDGTRWMTVDFRRNRPGRVDCLDPRRGRMFAARNVRECVDIHDR
ncbi:hypothetical protein [Fibrobacter sp. UWR2]|uniref:hypothetical protein n=1 Tax=Fibrobacter sp. UWR2 TaxID=1964352 RepID=UPI000B522E47|nr:hypothetical protein [Fibrobacter sp. UWR2]OWV02279.1 hypothetical protein B7994_03480 [Fibrobacter sp. UWR2]